MRLFAESRKCVRLLSLIVSTVGASSCGCDLVGCVDGLTVHLKSLPAGAFQVELLVGGTVQPGSPAATCDGIRACNQDIYFSTSPTDQVSVRVTTTAGARTTTYPRIDYTTSRPNGRYCDPACHNATVVADVPS